MSHNLKIAKPGKNIRLEKIIIKSYRSIQYEIEIKFPEKTPLILIGENNSGKSNIIRAIELMFGEFHPKYKKLEDYDHFNRDTNNQIVIEAAVSGLNDLSGFKFRSNKGKENDFVGIKNDGSENPYLKGELRDKLSCIVVNSEQNLSFQLSYATKYTLLSRVTKAFHDKLVENKERVNRLKEFFENIKSTFLEVKEFKEFNQNMSTISNSMMSNMQHALSFDFSSYDPSNYFKSLRVFPTEKDENENSETRAFEELGTGQQQILALSFAHAYAKSFLGEGLIFIIDEPEAHLHPLAQKWLAKKMFQMAEDGLQIVITTHSPYFVDLKYLEGIYLIRKREGKTYIINNNAQSLCDFCINHGSNREKTNKNTIIPFYANNSTSHILSGFFANKIILVEGSTEELALPIYFERLGFDVTEHGVEILGVGGKGNLPKWWRFFTAYNIPTYICFDNDLENGKNETKTEDILNTIGIQDQNFKIENSSWFISDKLCVFSKDFETTMRGYFEDYEDTEKKIKNALGSTSKSLIARETAKLIDLESESKGKEQFITLIEKIKNYNLD